LARGGRAGDILALQHFYNSTVSATLYTRPIDLVKDRCLNVRLNSNYITAV
jgi:hypothetical protein